MGKIETPRKMVSFRLPLALIRRWDRLSYLLRRPKGAIAQAALEEHLDTLEEKHPNGKNDAMETPNAGS
jgi:predicted DNA-binding protein